MVTVSVMEFHRKTPYYDLLPSRSEFLTSPFRSLKQYFDIYRMDMLYHSDRARESRKQKIADTKKREVYRKEHGITEEGTWPDYVTKTVEKYIGSAPEKYTTQQDLMVKRGEVATPTTTPRDQVDDNTYTDFEGQKRPVKKWLGIW